MKQNQCKKLGVGKVRKMLIFCLVPFLMFLRSTSFPAVCQPGLVVCSSSSSGWSLCVFQQAAELMLGFSWAFLGNQPRIPSSGLPVSACAGHGEHKQRDHISGDKCHEAFTEKEL